MNSEADSGTEGGNVTGVLQPLAETKVVAIVQARMGSTRLPGKVLKKSAGETMISILLMRLSRCREVRQIMVATSTDEKNLPLVEHVKSLGYEVVQGSENDVLDRYYHAASHASADIVVRITGDCPLIDPEVVDSVVRHLKETSADYSHNGGPTSYPDGLDTEAFTFSALKRAWLEAKDCFSREHVTPYLYKSGKFRVTGLPYHEDFSKERWTIDEPEDFEVINNIVSFFAPRFDFSWLEVLALRKSSPDLFAANQHLLRNEGALIGTGQKLWKRAHRVIPGGNMLLSKRAEMFLPDQWPAYFSKAKGCMVWDLDGKPLTDMSIMGIGTNILGYGHPEIDAAVGQVVATGNMSTLNCPEEVYLAEKLIELHPWAEMVRFARSGGEANAIAIRIARAAAGRDKVAICGYHGWHDWYLSANLGKNGNLDGHLLPGLEPKGVPRNLAGLTIPFTYNNLGELQELIASHSIGVIMMEVSRSTGPENGFLQAVRALATKHNIVLVFDECTSGFRETFGGLHKKYGVEPDIAMFGKALGNGYGITAVIGRRSVMQSAQSTFISSTFWTERIGPAAGLKTLEVMEREKPWEFISSMGRRIGERWSALAGELGLPLQVGGLPALISFSMPVDNWLKYKTLITQEMLKKEYLAANSVYVCTSHTAEVVEGYFEALYPVFNMIAECESGGDIDALLQGPVCHSGFKRLN